jgi:predicted nucleic acid-binding Zn ribbon protein
MVQHEQKTLDNIVCQGQCRNNQKQERVKIENIISYVIYNSFLLLGAVLPM